MIRFHCSIQFCLLLLATVLPAIGPAGETLRVLTWPGYADPDVVKVFERRTNSRVEVTLIDSDDVLWQKISRHNAEDFDVIAVNTAELQRYIRKGLVVPIDAGAIPNLSRQLPAFREAKESLGIARDGKVYAVPYTYAEMGLIYDRKQILEPPNSIAALWDPRHRGKVLAYNDGPHNFSLAALKMGHASPFQLVGRDWQAVVEQLIELRHNVLTFYTSPEESVELFLSRKAALLFANYGSQQLKLLRAAGADVGYVIPKEGALAWLDCWAITSGARDRKLAAAWINYLLEAAPGEVLLARQGLSNTTSPSPYHDPSDRLVWLKPVEDTERRNQLWERIFSGDRVARVLAP